LAIDGTETSDVTISFASAIAQHSGAVVHVLYVNEYVVGSRGVPLRTNAEATELLTGAVGLLRAEGIRVTGSAPAPLNLPADGRLVMAEMLDVERDRSRSLSPQ
jgi:nucleotide-binding universal stress UspA family protein